MTPEQIRDALAGLHPPPADPAPLRDELADALLEARRHPALEADWRMAEAALQHPDALVLWQEALVCLDGQRLTDQRYVHEQLARLRLSGGDAVRGRDHLRAALDIARRTDRRDQMRLAFRLGAALLVAGLPHEATPLLTEAVEAAARTQDSLHELGCASVLSALHLDTGDLTAAHSAGARVAVLGAERGNWIAVADGLITQSICHLRQDQPAQALYTILHGSRRLQEARALAALNLLKARLVEIREALGEETFDLLFEETQARISSEPRGEHT